ncbi:molybdopterin-dependent oxidoreductase, partial [Chloroflexota bacterium]
MSTRQVIRTTCGICLAGCGLLVHLEDGRPVKIEGNPESPVSHGVLCVKGLVGLELLEHPDRLKYPLKRMGKRGEGKWRRVSWDEALDTVARALAEAKSNYGTESVAFIKGLAKGLQDNYLA